MSDVVVLFEYTGLSAYDWAAAGHEVYCYDIQHVVESRTAVGAGGITKLYWDADSGLDMIAARHSSPAIIMCFAPCDDLASSGAKHMARKLRDDPLCQLAAVSRLRMGEVLGNELGAPWVCENPVGRAATLWRRPDVYINPFEFGGYLPVDDVHPMYPDYIAPRDAYPKKTGLWFGGGFIMPEKRPVTPDCGYSTQYAKLGGKSRKTKNIRSASPRGLMRAIWLYNDRR